MGDRHLPRSVRARRNRMIARQAGNIAYIPR